MTPAFAQKICRCLKKIAFDILYISKITPPEQTDKDFLRQILAIDSTVQATGEVAAKSIAIFNR